MNILIIENSITLAQLLLKTLESYDYKVTLDNKDFQNRNLVKRSVFELVIVNTNLGEENSKKIIDYIFVILQFRF